MVFPEGATVTVAVDVDDAVAVDVVALCVPNEVAVLVEVLVTDATLANDAVQDPVLVLDVVLEGDSVFDAVVVNVFSVETEDVVVLVLEAVPAAV